MDKKTTETTSQIVLPALKMLFSLTVLTGLIYPLFVMTVSKTIFQEKASGSIITLNEKPVGSRLIAQKFSSDIYFTGRPSFSSEATLPASASNFGPTSLALKEAFDKKEKKWGRGAPSDLLYTSASGLDPHLTVESVLFQFEKVAKARNLNEEKKQQLKAAIERLRNASFFRIFNTDIINILELNLALDKIDGHENARN